ncbi:MAG: hypothetical protein ACJAS4_002918 [Bacteriovoracaceae bacterium]|jgi:hypothetical protein
MVKLSFEGENRITVLLIKNIFQEKYKIPLKLIRVTKVSSCHSQDKRFLELCINKKGELVEFSNYNKKNIINSLKVFSQRRTQ